MKIIFQKLTTLIIVEVELRELQRNKTGRMHDHVIDADFHYHIHRDLKQRLFLLRE